MTRVAYTHYTRKYICHIHKPCVFLPSTAVIAIQLTQKSHSMKHKCPYKVLKYFSYSTGYNCTATAIRSQMHFMPNTRSPTQWVREVPFKFEISHFLVSVQKHRTVIFPSRTDLPNKQRKVRRDSSPKLHHNHLYFLRDPNAQIRVASLLHIHNKITSHLLSPWSTVLIEILMISRVNKILPLKQHECSLLCSQQPATQLYPKQFE